MLPACLHPLCTFYDRLPVRPDTLLYLEAVLAVDELRTKGCRRLQVSQRKG